MLNGGASKKPALPPEALFNLDGEQSIRTIHQRNETQPSDAGNRPPRKGKEVDRIDVFSEEEDSNEESAPSSGQLGRPQAAATIGVDDTSPTSSDEVNGQAPDAADGG